jgi:hypothetical protein
VVKEKISTALCTDSKPSRECCIEFNFSIIFWSLSAA